MTHEANNDGQGQPAPLVTTPATRRPAWTGVLAGFTCAALVWTGWWFWLASHTSRRIDGLKEYAAKAGLSYTATHGRVSGYPFRIETYIKNLTLQDDETTIFIPRIDAYSPAFPNMLARVHTQGLAVTRKISRNRTLDFTTQAADASIRMPAFWRPRDERAFTIEKLYIKSGQTEMEADGAVRLPLHAPYITGKLDVGGRHLDDLIPQLVEQNVVNKRDARMVAGILRMFSANDPDGVAVKIPVTIDDTSNIRLAGLFNIGVLPPVNKVAPVSPAPAP